MKFSDIITPSQIVLDLKAEDRWGVIEELGGELVKRSLIKEKDRDTVVQAVKTREQSISTGVGFGIAIPHASTGVVDRVTAILARSSKGINFDSLDNQPVRIVVLFLVPSGQYQEHLRTLSTISRFLSDRNFREQAEKAQTVEEIHQLILKRDA